MCIRDSVNNTVYFSFYDLGKTEYFASVCPHVDWQKDGIVVAHIEANFLAQIYGSDHIAVQTAVTPVSYTHLDVYKRQVISRFDISGCHKNKGRHIAWLSDAPSWKEQSV